MIYEETLKENPVTILKEKLFNCNKKLIEINKELNEVYRVLGEVEKKI